MPFFQH
jgi:Glu-tRNA(Gln) amidotransferase subunit E-like FAD-binding protein